MPATKNENQNGDAAMNHRPAPGSLFRHSSFTVHALPLFVLVLAMFIAGCTPPGPRALIKGKKYLDRGNFADAMAEFKTATSIMPTNAQAWNYLGVACQHAGESADAVSAYQNALKYDRDLMEAHYNLGCLWLDQNKFSDAKTEFTAYTLRRPNSVDGWLKLGMAQLRNEEYPSAEKSFSTVLYLNPNNAQAYNGLGLARVQRDHPREGAQFFTAAIQFHPDYAPAYLNLATTAIQYLDDKKMALDSYKKYLALTPRPANWEEVNAIVKSMEPSAPVAATATPTPANPVSSQPTERPRPSTMTHHPATNAEPSRTSHPATVTHPSTSNGNSALNAQSQAQSRTVQVRPEPEIVSEPPVTASPKGSSMGQRMNPMNWFRSSNTSMNYEASRPTPANPPASRPAKIAQPAPPTYPHYLFLSPAKPASGDRQGALAFFKQAQQFEQARQYADALQSYQQAARLDPGWFEAQYNSGVLAFRVSNYAASLAAWEMALAIQPGSNDARYNFSLALKAAGYIPDAISELKKIVAANPNDVRAQLALGNLYAQYMHDTEQARKYYLKVLDLDPMNPQTTDIRFWLQANPQ